MKVAGRVEWKMSSQVWFRWIVAILLAAVLGGVGVLLARDLPARPGLGALIVSAGGLLFGASVFAGLLFWAVSGTRVARRFGDAVLELATVPVSLGGRLQGRVRADAALAPDQAVNLVLRCWEEEEGSGDGGGSRRVRWGCEQLLTPSDVEQVEGALLVPVDLAVPGDLPPTGKADGRLSYGWSLTLSLEPRSGYAPDFEVPVARTAESPPEPEKPAEPTMGIVGAMHEVEEFVAVARHGGLAAVAATRHRDRPMPRPPHARVELRPRSGGGVEVVLPKSKTGFAFALYFVLTLPLWIAVPAWGLAEMRTIIGSPPLMAYLLYGGLGLGIPLVINGFWALNLGLQKRWLAVGPDGVIVERRIGRRVYPPGKFTTAGALGDVGQGWTVHLEASEASLLGGLFVAGLSTESEARWLAAELCQALGGLPPKARADG